MAKRVTRRRALAAGAALLAASPLMARPSAAASSLPDFVRPRAEWGAALPGGGMRAHAIERVILHHTGPPSWYGRPSAPDYLRAVQAFHTGSERGWADIAYHLLIDLDGTVWEGRSLTVAGDTATAYDPAGHALIAVLGDYDEQTPNESQLAAVAVTISWLVGAYNVDHTVLGGHRDYAATACPGRRLYERLPELWASFAPRRVIAVTRRPSSNT